MAVRHPHVRGRAACGLTCRRRGHCPTCPDRHACHQGRRCAGWVYDDACPGMDRQMDFQTHIVVGILVAPARQGQPRLARQVDEHFRDRLIVVLADEHGSTFDPTGTPQLGEPPGGVGSGDRLRVGRAGCCRNANGEKKILQAVIDRMRACVLWLVCSSDPVSRTVRSLPGDTDGVSSWMNATEIGAPVTGTCGRS